MKNLKALSKSFVKWLKVSRGLLGDKGTENCPLCKLYFNKGDCEGCPIKKYTGMTKCDGTPYETWVDHQNLMHGGIDTGTKGYMVQCLECKELAIDMFYFIHDVIDHEIGIERSN